MGLYHIHIISMPKRVHKFMERLLREDQHVTCVFFAFFWHLWTRKKLNQKASMISMATKNGKTNYHFPTHETYQMSKDLSNSESQNPELATLEGKQKHPKCMSCCKGKGSFSPWLMQNELHFPASVIRKKHVKNHIMAFCGGFDHSTSHWWHDTTPPHGTKVPFRTNAMGAPCLAQLGFTMSWTTCHLWVVNLGKSSQRVMSCNNHQRGELKYRLYSSKVLDAPNPRFHSAQNCNFGSFMEIALL